MNTYGKLNWALIVALLAVVLVLLIVLVAGLDNGKLSAETEREPGQATSEPVSGGLEVLSIQEQDAQVIVTTSYCVVKYPYAFSDLVQVETINQDEKASLRFYTVLDETKLYLYELVFDGTGSIPLGTITVGQKVMGVSAVIHQPGATLEGDVRVAFVAAQETFNDVVLSLKDNSNYVPTA